MQMLNMENLNPCLTSAFYLITMINIGTTNNGLSPTICEWSNHSFYVLNYNTLL